MRRGVRVRANQESRRNQREAESSALGAELVHATDDLVNAYGKWPRLAIGRSKAARRSARTSFRVLDMWSILLPHRVATEDLGDYLEDIQRRANSDQSSWVIFLRVVAAIFWTAVSAVSVIVSALFGRRG